MKQYININAKEFDALIVKRFLELCDEKEINQFKIHKESGIAKSTLSEFFNRSYKTTTTATVYRLCNALDISITEFFNHDYFK